MAGLDIKSIFTNMPLGEVIENCINNWFLKGVCKINNATKQNEWLIITCSKRIILIFDSSLYHQIDGVAMVSSWDPIPTNAFLCHYQKGMVR